MIDPDRIMYQWRQMTPAERAAALQSRQCRRVPWHGPPHYEDESGLYLLTAACYEHRPWIGVAPPRIAAFEAEWLETLAQHCHHVFAWVVLPNHYHALLQARDLDGLLKARSAVAREDVVSLERGRGLPRSASVAPRGRDRHQVGGAFLGLYELRAAQRCTPRLRETLAGLALFQRRAVPGGGGTCGSRTTLARVPAIGFRERLGPAGTLR